MIIMASTTAGNIDDVMDEILDYQVDGIVLASVAMSSEFAQRCNDEGIPAVLFNRVQDAGNVSSVSSDNIAGGRKLAEFFTF